MRLPHEFRIMLGLRVFLDPDNRLAFHHKGYPFLLLNEGLLGTEELRSSDAFPWPVLLDLLVGSQDDTNGKEQTCTGCVTDCT